ncbi:protease secretion system outer membrane protein [Acidovorax delafieldii]|uniref:TolC family outer membrane protein n=1 Tax=Acidovorax delafieldii TaxID=47920 RepID=UPI00285B3D65|nr:TolC family outer membrane protein [Acidovorax delafieldii]MDR6155124.1 protease secretion system outer membrane protein [Acidovorax delafieldii]
MTQSRLHRVSSGWLSPSFLTVGAIVVMCGSALPACAMDLRQAYEAAYANDASIRASRAGAQANRERLPQAEAQRLPNVAFSAGRNYNDLTSKTRNFLGQPVTTNDQYYSGSQTLSVRQPLYRPYISALVRQARAQVQDADATLEKDEQSLVVRVGEAYFDALLAKDQLSLVETQKTNYATQLDAAKKSLAAGSGTRTDIDEAQARLDLTLAQELEAIQNVEFTRRRLETLTGQSSEALASLDVDRFTPSGPEPAVLQAWVERAEQASPELQSLRAQLEVARQEIEKAEAGHKPTLDAVAQWGRSSSDSVTNVNSRYDNKSIGLQLSVPLYSGGYVNSTVRQAVAAHERAREVLDATRRDLGVRVHREFRGMTEGVLRISALQQAVRSAEQAVLSNRKSFEAGSRTTLDVLNAEQQKTTALRDLAQARYVYLVSRLRLLSLAGEDRQASVSQVNAWLKP